MKWCWLILFSLCISLSHAQVFKFGFVTDTHIGSPNGQAEEDLMRTVQDINAQTDIAFVLVTGDLTEMGTDEEISNARRILDGLSIPYYVVPGNHDTGWSESAGLTFIKTFGYDKFAFEYEGYKFIGTASGPYVRMSDGHIPRDAVVWLDSVLQATPPSQRIININHYPLDESLDNWFELTDRLKEYNTQFTICGHGHRNKVYDFEGIEGVMGRSNLRAKEAVGGYNIVEVTPDTVYFHEKTPGKAVANLWHQLPLSSKEYEDDNSYPRPDYAVNKEYASEVTAKWDYHSSANIISTPVVVEGLVIYGNSIGQMEALSLDSGMLVWTADAGAGVFSSPIRFEDMVIVGAGDGYVYAFDISSGEQRWRYSAEAAVLGSPELDADKVLIGGSDGVFRAIDAETGEEIWRYEGLNGPVVSKPLVYDGLVFFGAWDTYLYALEVDTGKLKWKWSNGSSNRMFSPAMCTPVAAEGRLFIVAPDRYMTAFDARTGEQLWRTNEHTVRESIGISEDGTEVYAKTMNDKIVAFAARGNSPQLLWEVDCHFGYDHIPNMLQVKNGDVYFGTKNSTIYSLDSKSQAINWKYKIDNSMANTVRLVDGNSLIVTTMDGKVLRLMY